MGLGQLKEDFLHTRLIRLRAKSLHLIWFDFDSESELEQYKAVAGDSDSRLFRLFGHHLQLNNKLLLPPPTYALLYSSNTRAAKYKIYIHLEKRVVGGGLLIRKYQGWWCQSRIKTDKFRLFGRLLQLMHCSTHPKPELQNITFTFSHGHICIICACEKVAK